MGMYTELVIGCRIPNTATEAVKTLEGWGYLGSTVVPDHPLFKTERWYNIGRTSSHYFPVSRAHWRFEYEQICGHWELSVRCSIKNYDGEIGLFIDWLRSVGAKGKGELGFIGYWMYEEDDEPTMIYLR